MQIPILLHLILFMVLPKNEDCPHRHIAGTWPRFDFDPVATSEKGEKHPKCQETKVEECQYLTTRSLLNAATQCYETVTYSIIFL